MTGVKHRWVGWLVQVVYVGIGVFPYLASGLVVPPPALAILMLCWGAGMVFTVRLARSRPVLSLITIPSAVVFWAAFVTLGSAVFDWTA